MRADKLTNSEVEGSELAQYSINNNAASQGNPYSQPSPVMQPVYVTGTPMAYPPQGQPVPQMFPPGQTMYPQGQPISQVYPQGQPISQVYTQGQPVSQVYPQGQPVPFPQQPIMYTSPQVQHTQLQPTPYPTNQPPTSFPYSQQ